MPIIEKSSFPGSPFWQFNGHLQTIAPGLFRQVKGVEYTRRRIFTPDDDFLDLDMLIRAGHRKVVILTHGLEGDSLRQYILGTAKLFFQNGWDVIAWNCRSCSGEMNVQARMYYHGDIEDIDTVIRYTQEQKTYEQTALVGYSMGGNISLKYVGVQGENAPVQAAIAISAPCALQSASLNLDRPRNNILYSKRFRVSLNEKMQQKAMKFPHLIDADRLGKVRSWKEFDAWFSAPVCGFQKVEEFYYQASSRNFMTGTRTPSLLLNAANDPFLTADCMPADLARNHDFLHFEAPHAGGHCGFQVKNDEFSWSERRALEFCEEKR